MCRRIVKHHKSYYIVCTGGMSRRLVIQTRHTGTNQAVA